MKAPILVTGGAGFVGQYLVRELIAQGETVRVLDRQAPTASHPQLQFHPGDITDRATVLEAVKGCRHVYHLAANPQLWTRRRHDFYRVNTVGTQIVLEESLRAGAERMLHCSTESILTRKRSTGPIPHDVGITRRDVVGPYCLSKFRAEQLAFGLVRNGAPIFIVNPTLPVGPGDRGLSPPTRMMKDFCSGGRSAYLDADLNLVDVRDVARGMLAAMTVGQPGRRYLLGAEDWSVKRVFDFLAAECGLPQPRWRVPYPVALAAAVLSEMIADWTDGPIPAATITGVRLTQRVMKFDASESWKALGITPRPIAPALREVVAEFRTKGWVRPRQ
ncbi:MAG: NAD-dependent epimerase/dehydratase family protein [Gemmataceae bacterium]